MSYSNGIVTAPVSFADVNAALSTNHTDLGHLCSDERINKFARFKPVRYPEGGLITDANRKSVCHGLVLPAAVELSGQAFGENSTTYAAIRQACEGDWGYNPPNGGASAPYRLADFANAEHPSSEGYYHKAVPPIQVNYPRDGWTFMRGSTATRVLKISVDLDPDDSAINLQSYDLTATGLNLNEWKILVFVDSNYFTNRLYESEFILDDGEIQGTIVDVAVPNGTGSYDCDVYICMYRFNNSTGKYEFMPLPKQGDFNPEYYTLHVKDDAQASGGGISGDDTEEMFNQILFSPSLDGVQLPTNLPEGYPSRSDFPEGYVSAWWTTDNGVGKLCMKCFGSLYVKLTLTNTSPSTSNVTRASMQCNLNDTGWVSASTMYNENKQVVNSVNIAGNGGTATIYLEFDSLFNRLGGEWTTSNKNSSWSADFRRLDATLFGGDIYAMYGSDGWIPRST